jgi:hypothetical protein
VRFNAAPVKGEGRIGNRLTLASQEPATTGLFQVPVAHLRDCRCTTKRLALFGWVLAVAHSCELVASKPACLLRREYVKRAKGQSTAPAFHVSILDNVRAGAIWTQSHAKAVELIVPGKQLSVRIGAQPPE